METEDFYFLTKSFVLLHDPPDKMWDLPGHEARAKELFRRIFNVGISSEVENVAKAADVFSASLDRFVYLVRGGDYVKYWKLHNIFNPRQYVELPSDYEKIREKAEEYRGDLIKRLTACRERKFRECYHALYALYEALWIVKGLPPSLADTRAPTHDVFDHLYAAAMVSNWLMEGEKPRGYLVSLDVPGVQDFISGARKAGDFWAGSWALSMAVWLTVWPFAWEFGPDVLLRPTARFNPIYHAFLSTRLEGIRDVLERLYEKFGVNPESAVVQPIIGERAILVLPPFRLSGGKAVGWGVGEVEEAIVKSFKDALRCINAIARGEEPAEGGACEALRQLLQLREANAFMRELGKLAELSLPLRIVVVDVEKEYDEMLCPERLSKLLGEKQCKNTLFFDWLLRARRDPKSPYVEQMRRRVPTPRPFFAPGEANKLRPEPPLNAGSPLNAFQPLWRYCSLCGNEPAVFGLRKVAGAGGVEDYHPDDMKNVEKAVGGVSKQMLRRVVRPGEFLGPSCLAKRLLYLRLQGSYPQLREELEATVVKFESTEDVAHAVLATKADVYEGDRCGNVRGYLKTIGKDLEAVWEGRDAVEKMKRDWDSCVESLGDRVAALLDGDLQIFTQYARGDLRKIAEALAGPRLFYAIVRGDGDNVGKLLDGCLPGDWYQVVEDVVRGLNADGGRFEGNRQFALEVMHAIRDYLRERAGADCGRAPVLITPTFRVAVSRALTISSLKDWGAVERYKGMLIYAGGDDVVALAPVEAALVMAGELRRNYWGEGGFHKIYNYPVPALAAYGRSFAVRFAHVMDLMSVELKKSHDDLEKAKEAKWKPYEKDSLAVSSSRTGVFAVLPFREADWVVQLLYRLWAYMLGGAISKNTPSDLDVALGEGDIRADIMQRVDVLGKLVGYVLKRNARRPGVAEEVLRLVDEGVCKYGSNFVEGVINAMTILRRLP